MKMAFLVVVAFVLSFCKARKDASDPKILNGKTVDEKSPAYHSTVAVIFKGNNAASFCTGTLIAKDTVLTAGHCVFGESSFKTYVHFSDQIIMEKTVDSEEKSPDKKMRKKVATSGTGVVAGVAVVEPGYENDDRVDTALIFFDPKLVPESWKPMPISREEPQRDTKMEVAGYGLTEKATEGQLYIAKVKSAKLVSRGKLYMFDVNLDGDSQKVCYGDSGGPLFANLDKEWKVLGVASALNSARSRMKAEPEKGELAKDEASKETTSDLDLVKDCKEIETPVSYASIRTSKSWIDEIWKERQKLGKEWLSVHGDFSPTYDSRYSAARGCAEKGYFLTSHAALKAKSADELKKIANDKNACFWISDKPQKDAMPMIYSLPDLDSGKSALISSTEKTKCYALCTIADLPK